MRVELSSFVLSNSCGFIAFITILYCYHSHASSQNGSRFAIKLLVTRYYDRDVKMRQN